MRPSEAHLLKFNVQLSQLLNNDFLVTVDVDARSCWLAVELLAVEVVPSVVVIAVNTNCADALWSILGDNHCERLADALIFWICLNGDGVLATLFYLEVRTVN